MVEADAAMRERLMAALASGFMREGLMPTRDRAEECAGWLVRDLLPVLRAFSADELRAAAETVERSKGIKFHGGAVRHLRARADALDPQ